MTSPINPKHYTKAKIEPVDFIEAQRLGFHQANIIKYITRAPHKGSQNDDYMKALNYLWRLITGEWMPAEVANRLASKAVTEPVTDPAKAPPAVTIEQRLMR